MAGLKGEHIAQYPLADFGKSRSYKKTIGRLVHSDNRFHRLLSYLVIAGAGDKAFEDVLLHRLTSETEKGNLIWAGIALMHLGMNRTTPLFDFLVANETFSDAHMIPLFVRLDQDSLQQTAYRRIGSDDVKARILAVQILAGTDLNPRTEDLLRAAVREWDIDLKGYAIWPMKELRMGNLAGLLGPLVDSAETRRIALEALANSPTEADRHHLHALADGSDTVPKDLLDGLYHSARMENVRKWMDLLASRRIPDGYMFFVKKQPIIRSDEILPDLHGLLGRVEDPRILSQLVQAMEGRTDERSVGIMLSMLRHSDSSVRYWAGSSLRGNPSEALVREIPALMADPAVRTTALVNLAIENDLDTLQGTMVGILADGSDVSLDWKRSSILYLSNFPKQQHREIFRAILDDEKEDVFVRRNAVLGLGRLRDEGSVDLIVRACAEESSGSDHNARTYLIALGMIKGERAKKEVEKFRNSRDNGVRELVAEILAEW